MYLSKGLPSNDSLSLLSLRSTLTHNYKAILLHLLYLDVDLLSQTPKIVITSVIVNIASQETVRFNSCMVCQYNDLLSIQIGTVMGGGQYYCNSDIL